MHKVNAKNANQAKDKTPPPHPINSGNENLLKFLQTVHSFNYCIGTNHAINSLDHIMKVMIQNGGVDGDFEAIQQDLVFLCELKSLFKKMTPTFEKFHKEYTEANEIGDYHEPYFKGEKYHVLYP